MRARIIKLIFLMTFVSNALSLNLQRLADDCLKDRMLHETENLKCETLKGVKVQRVQEEYQTFYCFKYEKKTGQKNEFDVLSFDLHEDYDLKYTGANVVSNAANNPQFKLYDVRTRSSYKGKFAISSENSSFDITNLMLNGDDQKCQSNELQLWPSLQNVYSPNADDELIVETTTTSMPTSARPRSTTRRWATTAEPFEIAAMPSTESSCGVLKKIESLGNQVVLPSQPGKFPWAVSIYRYTNEEEESYYKCAGSIIDKLTILTTVNCLLEDGQLLKAVDLQVYVAPFSLSARRPQSKIFSIAEIITHESFNFHLENNIAALRLSREIEFNDFIQPICLPTSDRTLRGKIGKLVGFGKASPLHPARSDLLTEAEFHVIRNYSETFDAENTSGNNRISDIGSGLYINETNRWMLAGILSNRKQIPTADNNGVFSFTNVVYYIDWLKTFGKQEIH